MVDYHDEIGWARLDDLVSPERAQSISEQCLDLLLNSTPTSHRQGDKPNGGTLRLVDVIDRIPDTAAIAARAAEAVALVLPASFRLTEATMRCPMPGFGQQKLHADDVPKVTPGPNMSATVIVALLEFTAGNGATRVVPGSHRRPDLQRKAGQLDHHRDEIRLLGPAGTGFVFSGHLIHSGMLNDSEKPRPALQFVWRVGTAVSPAGS